MTPRTCKDCGNQISTEEEVCPNCGAPLEKGSVWYLQRWYLKLVGVIVILLGITFAVLMRADNAEIKSVPSENAVHGEIQKTIGAIRVMNLDPFAWPHVIIFLNGTTNYYYGYDKTVEPGETITIEVVKFGNREGVRFNPREVDIEEVWLKVEGYDLPCYEF